MGKNSLALYIHIPFCVKKCIYCDFLSFTSTQEEQERYVKALLEELDQYMEVSETSIVTSIYIGGGTPSILDAMYITWILNKVKEVFTVSEEAEITIEVNPGTIDLVKLPIYKSMGINRISIGLQATNDEELRMLGRIHCYQDFLDTYKLVKKYGFDNINVDLISAIPKQTLASWSETLDRIIELEPTHISAYSLIIEEGTSLYENLGKYEKWLPSEDVDREMYYLTKAKLEKAGYLRYEISNYAKEGYECKHNLGYWDRVNYLGIGLGAATLIRNVRCTNEVELNDYIVKCHMNQKVYVEEDVLTVEEQMEEFMFLGLRKVKGVKKKDFEEAFHANIEEVYKDAIEKLCNQGLLIVDEETVALTDRGMDVSNYVFTEFLF